MRQAGLGLHGLVAALASLALADPLAASTFYQCEGATAPIKWDSGLAQGPDVTLAASDTSFPAGPWRDGLHSAIDAWNRSAVRFDIELGTTNDVSLANGVSEAWFTTEIAAPAETALLWQCDSVTKVGTLTEIDVRFNASWPFSLSTNKVDFEPYGGTDHQFEAVAVHELGHALGLGHTNDVYSVMGDPETHAQTNGATIRAYPGADASAGATSLYGPREGEDLGVVHWRYGAAAGEYSAHYRTRVVDATGFELQLVAGGSEPVYLVDAASSVAPQVSVGVQFTYENNGASDQAKVNVGYVLSSNDTITTLDPNVGSAVLNLPSRSAVTHSETVTLPDGLVPGQIYYLGAIIDVEDTLREFDETNNATYVAIRVRESNPADPQSEEQDGPFY